MYARVCITAQCTAYRLPFRCCILYVPACRSALRAQSSTATDCFEVSEYSCGHIASTEYSLCKTTQRSDVSRSRLMLLLYLLS